jgi:hypothetical protein
MVLKESWLTKRKLAGFEPEVKPVYKASQSGLLSHDAHEHFFNVGFHFTKLLQCFITLATSLGECCRPLRVEVPAVARCIAESVNRVFGGLVSSVILVPEVFATGAVEMDGVMGAKERLSPRGCPCCMERKRRLPTSQEALAS